MTRPGWLEALVLVLGAYRLLRLAGWDTFPLAAKTRAWVIGEYAIVDPAITAVMPDGWPGTSPLGHLREGNPVPGGMTTTVDEPRAALPGKQPSYLADAVEPGYRRPTLAHLVHCPYCLGAHISLGVVLAWWASPTWTTAILAPFALSGAIGLISKNLDS